MTSMPHAAPTGQTGGDEDGNIVGVDTHKDFHVAVVLSALGVLLGTRTFSATAEGYRQMLEWAREFGAVCRAGVEGSASYGAGLTRHLLAEEVQVLEISQPDRATRRRRGKTDAIDAEAAARAVLSGRGSAVAKSGDGPVEMARLFQRAKGSAIKARTQAINQLKAVLVSADPTLRESLAGLSSVVLVRRCAELVLPSSHDVASATVHTLRLLAQRIRHLNEEIEQLRRQLSTLLRSHTPRLLETYGVGPDSAAILLITAGDNPERLGTEASFAALCGVSPTEASSGKNQRRRLNRGGDRQANAALYRIVLTRLRWDVSTRTYLERRIAEGKTRREIIRCLKRYVAREIYSLLRPSSTGTVAHAATAAA